MDITFAKMQLVGVAYAKIQIMEKSSCKNSVNG
jgi:hypothetical protein